MDIERSQQKPNKHRASGIRGNRRTKMSIEEIAAEIEDIGGFYADWTEDFSESVEDAERRAGEDAEPKVYYTSGPDYTIGIPGTALDALEAAEAYTQSVSDASSEAAEYEIEAVDALHSGDIDAALSALESAAKCEARFGDCPTYRYLIEQIKGLQKAETERLSGE
jgi:hypothetical protein